MASTATKRIWWAGEQCQKQGKFPYVEILGKFTPVHPDTVEAWKAFDFVLRATDYDDAYSCWCYNCRRITGGKGYSLHAYGIATDIDPAHNPYLTGWPRFSWFKTKFTVEQVGALYNVRLNNGKRLFLWGGYWVSVKDYMHWELDVSPTDLKSGVDWSTVYGYEELDVVLKVGDEGELVEWYQSLMNKAGADPELEKDGDFGNKTKAGVEGFQEMLGQSVTGMIDGPLATWLGSFSQRMAQSGPKGDKGDPGEQGAKGDPGDKGDPGEPGKTPTVLQATEWS